MSKKTADAISRSDRVLVAALGIILATASAAIATVATVRMVSLRMSFLPDSVFAELSFDDRAGSWRDPFGSTFQTGCDWHWTTAWTQMTGQEAGSA